MVSPIIAAGLGKVATTVGKKAAKKFVKVKDLKGFVNKLKSKKNQTKKDKENINTGEDFLKRNKDSEYVSPDATVRMKAGGGKVKSKFFTGGTVNPSFGTDFDDR